MSSLFPTTSLPSAWRPPRAQRFGRRASWTRTASRRLRFASGSPGGRWPRPPTARSKTSSPVSDGPTTVTAGRTTGSWTAQVADSAPSTSLALGMTSRSRSTASATGGFLTLRPAPTSRLEDTLSRAAQTTRPRPSARLQAHRSGPAPGASRRRPAHSRSWLRPRVLRPSVEPALQQATPGQPLRSTRARLGPCRPETRTREVTVKLHEHGALTRWLFTASDEASDVRVSEPQGQFVVNLEGSGPIVFVAGGIGVTPALPTLRAAIAKGASRVVHIDCPIRVDDAPDLRALISGLVDALPRASLKVRVDGDGHPLDGAAIEAIVRAHKGATFYLCFKPELEAHGGSAAQACWSSPAHSGSSPSRGSPGVSRRRYEPYLCTVWSVYLPRRCSSCQFVSRSTGRAVRGRSSRPRARGRSGHRP